MKKLLKILGFSYFDYIFLGEVVSLFESGWAMNILKRVDPGPYTSNCKKYAVYIISHIY